LNYGNLFRTQCLSWNCWHPHCPALVAIYSLGSHGGKWRVEPLSNHLWLRPDFACHALRPYPHVRFHGVRPANSFLAPCMAWSETVPQQIWFSTCADTACNSHLYGRECRPFHLPVRIPKDGSNGSCGLSAQAQTVTNRTFMKTCSLEKGMNSSKSGPWLTASSNHWQSPRVDSKECLQLFSPDAQRSNQIGFEPSAKSLLDHFWGAGFRRKPKGIIGQHFVAPPAGT